MAEPRPGTTPPNWSVDTNFTNGPKAGTPTVLTPSTGESDEGFVPGQFFPGQFLNYMIKWISAWVRWLIEQVDALIALMATTTTDNAIARFDGTGGKLQTSALTVLDSGELAYVTPKTRIEYLEFRGSSAWAYIASPIERLNGDVNSGVVVLKLPIPIGGILTSMRVRLNPGESRMTTGGRIQLRVASCFPNFSPPSATTYTTRGSIATDDGTSNDQVVTLSSINYTAVAGERLVFMITAGNTANTFNDAIQEIEYTYTDAGPINTK